MSRIYETKKQLTQHILVALKDAGKPLMIVELYALLSPHGFTHKQVMRAVSTLVTHCRGVHSDGHSPARYSIDTVLPEKKRKHDSGGTGIIPRRYAPGVANPLTPKQYDLMSHYRMNAR